MYFDVLHNRALMLETLDGVNQRDEQLETRLRDVLTQPPFDVEWKEADPEEYVFIYTQTVLCHTPDVFVSRINNKDTHELEMYVIRVVDLDVYTSDLQLNDMAVDKFFARLDHFKNMAKNAKDARAGNINLDDMITKLFSCHVDSQNNKIVSPKIPGAIVTNGSIWFTHRKDFFKDWIVQGNFLLTTDKSDLTDAPKIVTGMFEVSDDADIKSLRGLPINCRSYSVLGFTDRQIKKHLRDEAYKQEARSHATSSGDADIDKMFDDVLEDL